MHEYELWVIIVWFFCWCFGLEVDNLLGYIPCCSTVKAVEKYLACWQAIKCKKYYSKLIYLWLQGLNQLGIHNLECPSKLKNMRITPGNDSPHYLP